MCAGCDAGVEDMGLGAGADGAAAVRGDTGRQHLPPVPPGQPAQEAPPPAQPAGALQGYWAQKQSQMVCHIKAPQLAGRLCGCIDRPRSGLPSQEVASCCHLDLGRGVGV